MALELKKKKVFLQLIPDLQSCFHGQAKELEIKQWNKAKYF